MAQYMNRTPNPPGANIWNTPSGRPMQFYEARYNTVGPQEWIMAPDAGPWYVTLYFNAPGGGAAFIEGSDECPEDILGQFDKLSGGVPAVCNVNHTYPLTDTVIDIVRVKVEGATAIRVNVLGGTVDVTARC